MPAWHFVGAMLSVAMLVAPSAIAFADPAATPPAVAGSPPAAAPTSSVSSKEAPQAAKAAREKELEAVQSEQRKAAETEANLRKQIGDIGEDRRKLSDDLIATASRIRTLEDRITGSEARLKLLSANELKVRSSLESRRGVMIEVLAALQRMGRTPAPAILVSPEDALASVRAAILLGAVLPQMQSDARALASELAELVRVQRDITLEREGLTRDLAALSGDRERMTLLVEERQKKLAETQQALESERQRAASLARQADSLKDLIAKLESDASASVRVDSATAQGKVGTNHQAGLESSGRLAPAIAFATAKGVLPLPVSGVKLREYGSPDGLGGTEKGLWIASRASAQVTAPCDGWVVYAGSFRSYGQLLILNAGGGYHVLLAGMERISVDLGQFVLTGEPVAMMGGGPQSAAAVSIGSNQPVLYVEFRKDGAPVDPSPWWATTDSEKVRG